MSNQTFEDLFNLVCGKQLGEGIHRKVFECSLRDDLVVKVEKEEVFRFFANVHEIAFYNAVPYAAQRWLAKPDMLSPDGRILLMQRAMPATDLAEMPTELPAFLCDIKLENFGWVREKDTRRLVCLDYALVHFGKPSLRMCKVKWK
jgi:hypothetical protein